MTINPTPPQFDPQRVTVATAEFGHRARQTSTAYLWWFFLGAFGAHKFYLGRTGMGIAYIFTLGFVGIGLLVDLFGLPGQVRTRNREIEIEIFGRHGMPPIGLVPTPGFVSPLAVPPQQPGIPAPTSDETTTPTS